MNITIKHLADGGFTFDADGLAVFTILAIIFIVVTGIVNVVREITAMRIESSWHKTAAEDDNSSTNK